MKCYKLRLSYQRKTLWGNYFLEKVIDNKQLLVYTNYRDANENHYQK